MKIKEEDKPKILAALFNHSRPLGMGFLHYQSDHQMDKKEAKDLLSETKFFDYLEGRVMKLDFSTLELDTWLYNRDNGDNAAENIIKEIYNK